MSPYNQFTSRQNNFRATLIPVHVIGCDFMFHVYNLNTNLKVGTLDGNDGTLRPQDTDSSLSSNQLKELATLCEKVQAGCEAYV